jgi:hypothetical protein
MINFPVGLKESLDLVRVPMMFGYQYFQLKGKGKIHTTLGDHVVLNHTSCHDIGEGFLIPE